MERKYQKLVITLENVGQADAIALIKMFKYMEHLGNIGSSRWCSFFADGDGAFRPKVSFEYPEELPEVPEIDGRTVVFHDKKTKKVLNVSKRCMTDFAIDSDNIAWKIYHDD
ncbi:MAG TPA: hypothetical protein PK698_07265 [Bacilli bacterium]|jgi:hypothetical protein|nr:MAG: hypothetical protein BWX59_02355 [Bacteroidetes bacterium ADurb.Bin028]HOH62249.1 hypothetical protein [Bacilli bacterium]